MTSSFALACAAVFAAALRGSADVGNQSTASSAERFDRSCAAPPGRARAA